MPKKNSKTIEDLKQRLLEAIRVLSSEGVLDGSRHLSTKIPDTKTFIINPHYAGILATPADLCVVDFSAKRVAGAEPIPLETVIHSAIYKARANVGSVLHCQPRFSILVGLQESSLIPFNRDARLFADGVPVFPNSAGINSRKARSADARSDGRTLRGVSQGVGVVVAEQTIEGNAISAIRLERAARDQILLSSFSQPKPLNDSGQSRIRSRMDHPYRIWPYQIEKRGAQTHPLDAKANLAG